MSDKLLTAKDIIFSTEPTKELLKEAENSKKLLIVYNKDQDLCLKFRILLGESSYLFIYVDQSPYLLKDKLLKDKSRALNFEEFYIEYHIEQISKEKVWYAPAGVRRGRIESHLQ